METLRATVRRNILSRLLDGKRPIKVVFCRFTQDLQAEADAAAACVDAARAAAKGRKGDAQESPYEIVNRVADYITSQHPTWGDGVLAATAAKAAIAYAEELGVDTETDTAAAASSAAAWAAAAAAGESLVDGYVREALPECVLAAAVKAAAGSDDDRALVGVVILAVAAALRAYAAAAARTRTATK